MTFLTTDLVSIRRVIGPEPRLMPAPKPARMVIVGDGPDAVPVYVPYAPVEVSHSNLGGEYTNISRPGLPNAIVFNNPKLPEMQFNLLLMDKQVGSPYIQAATTAVSTPVSIISTLNGYASQGKRVRVSYGALESGYWYITELSLDSARRDPLSDEITIANVAITLTRAEDVTDGVGPLTGGAVLPAATRIVISAPPQQTSARYYPVVSGDTLWSISIKFYGDGNKWTQIADANNIKDPRVLTGGMVLRIP